MPRKAKSDELSRRDRNRLIEWGGKFLRTVSTNPQVMRDMVKAGYSLKANRKGWDLYMTMIGGGKGRFEATVGSEVPGAVDARRRLEEFRTSRLREARAAIAHHHPDLLAGMFQKLPGRMRSDGMWVVMHFLNACSVLRDPPLGRGEPDQRFRDALKLLARRGILTPEIEAGLQADVDLLRSTATSCETVIMPTNEDELKAAAAEFRTWLMEWRLIAQAHVARRDHRILLGISRPRSSSTKPEKTARSEPVVDA